MKNNRRVLFISLALAVLALALIVASLPHHDDHQLADVQQTTNAAQATLALYSTRQAGIEARSTEQAELFATAQAQTEDRFQRSLAHQLAAQAELMRNESASNLQLSMLLATESMLRSQNGRADETIRYGLSKLPHPVAAMPHTDTSAAYKIVWDVAFSPDGKYIATGSSDYTARVWEAATGREITRVPHHFIVTYVAFSPDGRYVASQSTGTMLVWEATTGRVVRQILHSGDIQAVQFSPDGKYLATAGYDRLTHVWSIDTGETVISIPQSLSVRQLAFSPDGRYLATVTGGDEMDTRVAESWIWDISTGEAVLQLMTDGQPVVALFDPTGQHVATTSWNATQIWTFPGGREVARLEGGGRAAAFSPDGQSLALVSRNGWRVWHFDSGEQIAAGGEQSAINTVVFSPDGELVASSGGDGTARVWNVRSGQEISRMTHAGAVHAVAFSPDGKYVATASADGTACVWEAIARPGDLFATLPHTGYVQDAVFSPDGRYLATTTSAGATTLWRMDDLQEIACITATPAGGVGQVIFSASGRFLASKTADTLHILETASGKETAPIHYQVLDPKNNYLREIAFSPDEKHLASASHDKTVRIWDIETGKEVERITLPSAAYAVAYSPDDQHLATAGNNGAIQLWNPVTLNEVKRFSITENIYGIGIAFSTNGRLLVAFSEGGEARLWELETGWEILHIYDTSPSPFSIMLSSARTEIC
jgi:WD40 repeat protein